MISPAKSTQLQYGCYAFNVRAKGEETVAKTLRDKGYEVLLPSYIQERRYSDRIRRVSCALFQGYVFAYASIDSMMGILGTQGTNYVLRSGGTIAPLCLEDEQAIRALCMIQGEREPCSDLQVGVRVLVESGPLAGLTGTLTSIKNKDWVVINVESIHRSVAVEIGNASLRLLDNQGLGDEFAIFQRPAKGSSSAASTACAAYLGFDGNLID